MAKGRRRTVRALIPVVCPSDVMARGLVDDVTDHVGTTVAAFSPVTRRAFAFALIVIEAAGMLHRAPFSRLPPETAARVVARLSSGSPTTRRLVRSVRDVVVVAYFDQPDVKDRLGYRPAEWTATTAAGWREEWGDEAERHRELLRTRLTRPGLDV